MSSDELDSARRDPQTYAIIGACMEVHNVLGHGFLEAVYQEALAIELDERSIPFVREKPLTIKFKNSTLTSRYEADFFCYDAIVLELKALAAIAPGHHAQTIHYLKATGVTRGLLVNFGAPRLEYKRFILTQSYGILTTDESD
ncbi:MAG: GxxExxY protein [Pirellulales bacterium]